MRSEYQTEKKTEQKEQVNSSPEHHFAILARCPVVGFSQSSIGGDESEPSLADMTKLIRGDDVQSNKGAEYLTSPDISDANVNRWKEKTISCLKLLKRLEETAAEIPSEEELELPLSNKRTTALQEAIESGVNLPLLSRRLDLALHQFQLSLKPGEREELNIPITYLESLIEQEVLILHLVSPTFLTQKVKTLFGLTIVNSADPPEEAYTQPENYTLGGFMTRYYGIGFDANNLPVAPRGRVTIKELGKRGGFKESSKGADVNSRIKAASRILQENITPTNYVIPRQELPNDVSASVKYVESRIEELIDYSKTNFEHLPAFNFYAFLLLVIGVKENVAQQKLAEQFAYILKYREKHKIAENQTLITGDLSSRVRGLDNLSQTPLDRAWLAYEILLGETDPTLANARKESTLEALAALPDEDTPTNAYPYINDTAELLGTTVRNLQQLMKIALIEVLLEKDEDSKYTRQLETLIRNNFHGKKYSELSSPEKARLNKLLDWQGLYEKFVAEKKGELSKFDRMYYLYEISIMVFGSSDRESDDTKASRRKFMTIEARDTLGLEVQEQDIDTLLEIFIDRKNRSVLRATMLQGKFDLGRHKKALTDEANEIYYLIMGNEQVFFDFYQSSYRNGPPIPLETVKDIISLKAEGKEYLEIANSYDLPRVLVSRVIARVRNFKNHLNNGTKGINLR